MAKHLCFDNEDSQGGYQGKRVSLEAKIYSASTGIQFVEVMVVLINVNNSMIDERMVQTGSSSQEDGMDSVRRQLRMMVHVGKAT